PMGEAIERTKAALAERLASGEPLNRFELRKMLDDLAETRRQIAKEAGDKQWSDYGNAVPEAPDQMPDYWSRKTGQAREETVGFVEHKFDEFGIIDNLHKDRSLDAGRHADYYDAAVKAIERRNEGVRPQIEIDGRVHTLSQA